MRGGGEGGRGGDIAGPSAAGVNKRSWEGEGRKGGRWKRKLGSRRMTEEEEGREERGRERGGGEG